jgi:hypothetical protein
MSSHPDGFNFSIHLLYRLFELAFINLGSLQSEN